MDLVKELRTRRESTVEVGAMVFTVRRPRELEMAAWSASSMADVAIKSVHGWIGVTVGDVTGKENDDLPVEYSRELADEWLPDRPDIVVKVWGKVQDLIAEHHAKREEATKN